MPSAAIIGGAVPALCARASDDEFNVTATNAAESSLRVNMMTISLR
jgi:hypothetical protein